MTGAPAIALERRVSLILAGVGGQGVLTTAKVLGAACHAAGLKVVVAQMHGMAQRGGSVQCTVNVGPGQSSFVMRSADVLLAFEPLELLRALPLIGAETRVVVNTGTIPPWSLSAADGDYPAVAGVLEKVRATGARVVAIDGPALIAEVGERRSLNMAMLGALAALQLIPLSADDIWGAATAKLKPKYRDANRKAFDLGLGAVETQGSGDG